MGVDVCVASVSYVVINRDQINKELEPKLRADQSVADWVKLHFPKLRVIEGVDDKRYIFDSAHIYLRERLGYSSDDEEEEPDEKEVEIRKKLDFEWAAIVMTNLHFELEDGPDHCSSFNPNKIKKLFANSEQDLRVHNEVWARQS